MGGNPFSKKMCQELLLFEDYLLSCKTALFHKEQIVVDRNKTLSLIAELRSYHCADRSVEGAEDTIAPAQTQTPQMADHQAEPAADIPPQRREPARPMAEGRESRPLMTVGEEEALREAAQAEAEHIIAQAREQAKYMINEAVIKADVLLKQAEERVQEKQVQVDDLLAIKITDADKRAREIMERAHQSAALDLETKHQQIADMLLAGFQKADHLIEIAENVYAKQLDVVRADRQEILDILQQLQRMEKNE